MTCAPSEETDRPWHLLSLIRVFAVRLKKVWVHSYPTEWMPRLISNFNQSIFRTNGMILLAKLKVPPLRELPPESVPECGNPLRAMLPQGLLPQEERHQVTRAHLVPEETDGMRHPELKEVMETSVK